MISSGSGICSMPNRQRELEDRLFEELEGELIHPHRSSTP